MATQILNLSSANDPITARLSTLNLRQAQSQTPTVTMSGSPVTDQRVRISMFPNSPKIFYRDSSNILLYNNLSPTGGVLFPYQPTVDISFEASYQSQTVSQNNFAFQSYENSQIKSIDIRCDFPARNQNEGLYVVAAVRFLQSLTMSFTSNDGSVLNGNPPLIVRLSGMGFGGLDYIPVAITNVTRSFPDDVDYISVSVLNGEVTRVPTMSVISVSCLPMFSRAYASQFSATAYARGYMRLLGPNFSMSSNMTGETPSGSQLQTQSPEITALL